MDTILIGFALHSLFSTQNISENFDIKGDSEKATVKKEQIKHHWNRNLFGLDTDGVF
ncbi:MAG: hypothetical protein ACI3XN_02225 [Eubacteriales bacterium]